MDIDLPYKAEYAKTGRAGCKGCRTPIAASTLRLAAMVQSAFHDGKQPNWYHFDCFFKKQHPASEGDIDNFQGLRIEDQKRIRDHIGSNIILPSSKKGGKKRSKKDDTPGLQHFGIEYAKSGRASCVGCQLKISKDEIRIKKTVFDTEIGMKFGGQPLWHHVECFAQCRNNLGWFETGEKLPGFGSLNKEDKENVKKHLPAIKAEDIPPEIKKPKLEDDKESKELDSLIEKQTKDLFKLRDKIEKYMSRHEIKLLLEENDQQPKSDLNQLLDMAADMLMFGALSKCDNCKTGQFIFSKSGYLCTGELEWSKCSNFVKEPKRSKYSIPKSLSEKFDFLKKCKNVSKRAIKYIPPSTQTIASQVKIKKEDELDGPKVKREKPPLYNFQIAIIGIKDDDKLKKQIAKFGGKITTKMSEKTIFAISTPEEVEKMGNRMKKAKDFGVHIVPVEYLDAIKNDPSGAVSFITSKSLCDWGVDPHNRLPAEESVTKSKSIYTKSVPKSMTLKIKDGLAVDPDSGLEDRGHVYVSSDGLKYNVVLGLTDIQSKKNSYYKMQIIESQKKNKYWVYRSWGRIGTTIGGTKLENHTNPTSAIMSFEEIYLDKTGNEFIKGHVFVKKPRKMYPIDIDYGEQELQNVFKEKHSVESKLHERVQEIVKLIFDINAMKKVMMEFELDTEKMPLGKLSQKQIQSAYKVLSEISELIQNGATNAQFIDCTNRFYTLIPHSFGVDNPPLLDSTEQIKHHSEMLDSLMEIEIAYSMLKSDESNNTDINPIDKHYIQLKTDLVPLDKNSEEFKIIDKYVQNTHAETHRSYELEIVDIFKVSRKGESRRFKPFKKLHNRKLLWHGSRLTNFAGILSHGLKIAPPEAPVTGYMFGKGIYFADMVSKSANYCVTSKQNPTGLMLLSEVALGDMIEYKHAKYVTELPKNKHSTKGIGRTQPDPKESFVRDDGVEIPCGKPITEKVDTSLLYNEYIVYDVAQVNIQYLLRMNFKYKY